jgi:hypothetical protein
MVSVSTYVDLTFPGFYFLQQASVQSVRKKLYLHTILPSPVPNTGECLQYVLVALKNNMQSNIT